MPASVRIRRRRIWQAAIGKSVVSYAKKERGDVKFSDEEKIIVARELDLTSEQVNSIFFDSSLPER